MSTRLFKLILTFLVCILGVNAQAQPTRDQVNLQLDYMNPQKYVIKEITVSGEEFLDPQVIISLSQLRIGDEITIPGTEISNALKRIWKENLVKDLNFSVTSVEGNQITLNIHLVEQLRINHPIFYGTKKTEESDLKEKLGLVRSQIYTQAIESRIERTCEKYYKEKGYLFAKADASDIPDTTYNDFVNIKIKIDKGVKCKINKISFIGNDLVEDKTLKKKLKKTKEKKGWRFYSRSKYIESEYKAEANSIIELYNSLGMRDARIIGDPEIIYPVNGDSSVIDLKINIREGNVYYYRNISWAGNYIHNEKELNNILKVKKGDVYDKSKLDTRLNFDPSGLDVSSLYLDDGYLFFSVNPVETTVVGDSIDIELRVYEGQQAVIDEIRLHGNTKTSDHVILREIRTLPGQKFSRSDLIRTQREIAALGYFDPEQIQIVPIPDPQTGTVDIDYHVVEKPSDQLQLSGGWGGAVKFVGTLGLVFNNFWLKNLFKVKTWSPLPAGGGQRLSIRAQSNGPFFQSYTFSFTEPWLGGKKPNSFTLSLNHSRQSRGEDSWLRVSGATISFGQRWKKPDDYFTFLVSPSYLKYNVNNFTVWSDDLPARTEANNLSVETTIARDNIGINPQFPTTGSRIQLSMKITPPWSLLDPSITDADNPNPYKFIEYHKWMFDYNRYLQLTGNRVTNDPTKESKKTSRPLVLNTRAHMGFIAPLNNDFPVGPFDRFSLGGSGITGFNFLLGTDVIGLRGYEDNSLQPDGGGGVAFGKFVTELRFPLVTEGMATIFVLGFLEAGNTWGNLKEFDPFKLKRSAGIGARIFMPAFGMIGVDYGYGFDEIVGKSGANKGQFHFSIGQMIR